MSLHKNFDNSIAVLFTDAYNDFKITYFFGVMGGLSYGHMGLAIYIYSQQRNIKYNKNAKIGSVYLH